MATRIQVINYDTNKYITTFECDKDISPQIGWEFLLETPKGKTSYIVNLVQLVVSTEDGIYFKIYVVHGGRITNYVDYNPQII